MKKENRPPITLRIGIFGPSTVALSLFAKFGPRALRVHTELLTSRFKTLPRSEKLGVGVHSSSRPLEIAYAASMHLKENSSEACLPTSSKFRPRLLRYQPSSSSAQSPGARGSRDNVRGQGFRFPRCYQEVPGGERYLIHATQQTDNTNTVEPYARRLHRPPKKCKAW